LQRLLTTDLSLGRNIDNSDESVKRSRRADFRAMPAKGPFYLVRHVSCHTSQCIIDRLGELMHAREYSYVSSEISGPPSHSPGSVQHKFDSICVLHGEDKCRAICFRATIDKLQVLRFYRVCNVWQGWLGPGQVVPAVNWVMVGVLWRFVASYPGVMRPSYMCWGPEGCDVAVVYTGIWC